MTIQEAFDFIQAAKPTVQLQGISFNPSFSEPYAAFSGPHTIHGATIGEVAGKFSELPNKDSVMEEILFHENRANQLRAQLDK